MIQKRHSPEIQINQTQLKSASFSKSSDPSYQVQHLLMFPFIAFPSKRHIRSKLKLLPNKLLAKPPQLFRFNAAFEPTLKGR